MSAADDPETVSLWSLWRDQRDALVPFGECCAKARRGDVPGAVPVSCGTHRIRIDRINEALAAMHKDDH